MKWIFHLCERYIKRTYFLDVFLVIHIIITLFKITSLQDLPRSNVLYGYRIDGPRGWHQGHRFDSSIVLIDPYAKLVEGRRYFGDASNKFSRFLGSYDFDSLPFDWGENYELPNIHEVIKLLICLLSHARHVFILKNCPIIWKYLSPSPVKNYGLMKSDNEMHSFSF
jgi:hypothetical protein